MNHHIEKISRFKPSTLHQDHLEEQFILLGYVQECRGPYPKAVGRHHFQVKALML